MAGGWWDLVGITFIMRPEIEILNYGGGRQTVAECVLVKRRILPKPDRIIIADTGREKSSTWDYLTEVTQPLLASIGLSAEIAPRALAYVDIYGLNGDLLLPVFTPTGKLSAFCSDEWKGQVVKRYLHLLSLGYTPTEIATLSESRVREEMKRRIEERFTNWIGFAWDERKRIKGTEGRKFPLCDLMLTKADCIKIIQDEGLPLPPPSSCWMCPNMPNEEWRYIRDNYPGDFEQACQIDDEVRTEDLERGNGGVWLHESRVPLRQANLDVDDRKGPARQCGLGLCMI